MVPLKVEAIVPNGRPMAANLPTALTASFAVYGSKHEVARHRSVRSRFGGFLVSNLSYQDDVGILPEDSPESGTKGDSLLRFHLRLCNLCEIVFDRILDGHDVDFTVGHLA